MKRSRADSSARRDNGQPTELVLTTAVIATRLVLPGSATAPPHPWASQRRARSGSGLLLSPASHRAAEGGPANPEGGSATRRLTLAAQLSDLRESSARPG